MIDEKNIRHIAKLARLGVTDEQVIKFASQLDDVFEYMNILNEAPTDGVLETSQVTGLRTVFQKDEISRDSDPEELLRCSELALERHQIKVKPVFE